ncbi:YjzD family protein [Ligilactobacillus faecis]|uniref:YjzD family protein n=1 Tax=Ligilactobacillus faecis TaxID=762833 RepID=A0ABV4DQN9_9LACO|nr:YjzD family protein [Ligilactobacillus faecis]WGN89344.1 YjzD family protein [Ligilactobacillus faecis]
MAKQLTILFWGFIYGEVIGYILSALSGSTFEPLSSGLIAMVAGWIAVNCLTPFIKSPTKTSDSK